MTTPTDTPPAACDHRYVTSFGAGWVCADCKARILSLVLPLVIAERMDAAPVHHAGINLEPSQ